MSDSSLLDSEQEGQVEQRKEPETVVDGNGSGARDSMSDQYVRPKWTEGLSGEQKEELEKSRMKLPEKLTEFWSRYTQLEANAKNAVVIPGKDAPAEDWKAYREKMGIPEAPDQYAFEKPQLPEGMAYDEGFEQWFRTTAHELNIPASAAKELFNRYNALAIENHKAQNVQAARSQAEAEEKRLQSYTEAQKVLQSEWGSKYAERLSAVRRVFSDDRIVTPAMRDKARNLGLDNDPDYLKQLDLLARATASDRSIGLVSEAGEATSGDWYGEGFKKRYVG